MSNFPVAVRELAQSGQHLAGQEKAPRRYKGEVEGLFRQDLIAMLSRLSYVFLGTLSADGWPQGNALQFVSEADEGDRPVLYVAVAEGSALVANLSTNPRVTCETHYAISFEQRRETRAAQFQAVASIVTDAAEQDRARHALAEKFDAAADEPIVPDAIMIRIDVLSAVFFFPARRPQWGFIDYIGNKPD